MRQFSFTAPKAPVTIRGAQSLLYLQGGMLILTGAFVLMISVALGSGNAIPFAGTTVSGGGAMVVAVFYALLGGGAVYIGVELGRAVSWSRTAAIGLEAVLIVLFMARGDLSISSALSVLLCVAVAALVVASIYRTDQS